VTPRNGHEKSSLIDPIQQIPDDIRSDRTSRVMISMMGMIHLIRLDNPQYYLRKFRDGKRMHYGPDTPAASDEPATIIGVRLRLTQAEEDALRSLISTFLQMSSYYPPDPRSFT
jgi:hypothetical protein